MKTLHRIFSKFRAVNENKDGLAAIEMVIVIPILLAMIYGVVEVSRYVMFSQKLSRTTSTVADVVAQANVNYPVLDGVIPQINGTIQGMMKPYAFNGNLIISDVINVGGRNIINWQTGDAGNASRIGNSDTCSAADLSSISDGTFSLNPGDEVVIVEMSSTYTPIRAGIIGPNTLNHTSVYPARNHTAGSALISAWANSCDNEPPAVNGAQPNCGSCHGHAPSTPGAGGNIPGKSWCNYGIDLCGQQCENDRFCNGICANGTNKACPINNTVGTQTCTNGYWGNCTTGSPPPQPQKDCGTCHGSAPACGAEGNRAPGDTCNLGVDDCGQTCLAGCSGCCINGTTGSTGVPGWCSVTTTCINGSMQVTGTWSGPLCSQMGH